MTAPSFHDMETLSAYLDGQISRSERTRLEKRLQSDAVLAEALKELRQTRALLRRTPKRRVPRNFILTPKMAGIRPPVPRLVPVFSWASAAAMVLFIFTLGTSLVSQVSFGAAAPKLAAAPMGLGGGPPPAGTAAPANVAPAPVAPATAAPATAAPAPLRTTDQGVAPTPTAEAFVMSVPQATPPVPTNGNGSASTSKVQPRPLNPWLIIWPSLAIFLFGLAALVRWLNRLAFQRKNPRR